MVISQMFRYGSAIFKQITRFKAKKRQHSDHYFSMNEVAALHRHTLKHGNYALDDASWDDLLIEDYLKKLSPGASIYAQQVFYQRLRCGQASNEFLQQQTRLQSLIKIPSILEKLELDCDELRAAETEVASVLFDTSTTIKEAWWHRNVWFIPLSAAISAGLSYFNPLALLATAIIICVMFYLQIQFHNRVYLWNLSSQSLQVLLRTCHRLSLNKEAECDKFKALRDDVIVIHKNLRRPGSTAVVIPEILAYLDWFQMANIRHYFKGISTLNQYRTRLQCCFFAAAELEADIKLARHFLLQSRVCFANVINDDITFDHLVHPLISYAAPLPVSLRNKGCFISGQNGVGKSTFLRAIGLNLVIGKAFGFCYANHANININPVYTSIHNEDSLIKNESFYIAEMKRAKTLVDAANGSYPCTFIIDEIFRGTNYFESVSAATAVLKELSKKGLLIVASHNLILANLLSEYLTPLYISHEDGQLTIQPGLVSATNGVQLLAEFNFSKEIKSNANHVLERLNQHMTSANPENLQMNWA